MCWLRIWPQDQGTAVQQGPEKGPEKEAPLPWGLSELLGGLAGPMLDWSWVEIRYVFIAENI